MTSAAEDSTPTHELSAVLVPLFKGVTYRADDPAHWHALLQLQGRVRDHVAVLGLALSLDEAEGYAFLRSLPEPDQVDAQLNKVIELGFVRRLRGQDGMFEVQRILKAFVDAQWLAEFDARLAAYRASLGAEGGDEE